MTIQIFVIHQLNTKMIKNQYFKNMKVNNDILTQ